MNGIRSAIDKGFIAWLKASNPDVLCLQEVKANIDQVDITIFHALGYQAYWHSAQKKGYSGVVIFSKIAPKHVEIGCGIEKYDVEGRAIRIDFEEVSILNVYMPSGSSGEERQAFKYDWMADFYDYTKTLISQIPNLIIVGDYNICHQAIDIHNPKSNAKSSGFLPEEREWLSKFMEMGFVDTFRHFNPEPHHYTWWSYRAGARKKNLGWRIDYQMATLSMQNRLLRTAILSEAMHSDHCPVLLEII
ncbi:MAG: Exodeoxyribonuclease [Bacteroidota bacterium]